MVRLGTPGTLTDTGGDSRGIEADNSEFDQAAIPFSDPDFCNVTFIGGKNQPLANNGSDAGILLRRGTRAQSRRHPAARAWPIASTTGR